MSASCRRGRYQAPPPHCRIVEAKTAAGIRGVQLTPDVPTASPGTHPAIGLPLEESGGRLEDLALR